ncbi:cupin domain-containing protein [Microbacterium sp. MC2]
MSDPTAETSTLIAAGTAELLAENPIEPGRITPHKTFDGAGVRIRHLALDANAVMTDHSAPRPIIISVAAGRVRLVVGEVTHTLVAGGLIHMDANVRHEVFADEPSHLLVYLLGV